MTSTGAKTRQPRPRRFLHLKLPVPIGYNQQVSRWYSIDNYVIYSEDNHSVPRGLTYLLVITLFALSLNPYADFVSWLSRISVLFSAIGVIIAVCLCMTWQPVRRLYTRIALGLQRAGGCPGFLLVAGLALVFFGLTAYASQALFDGIPRLLDSQGMFMHARLLAEGKWCGTQHSLPQFFAFSSAYIQDGKFCSTSYPGHLLLLALGFKAGFPWLVNPLLGGLGVVAIFLLGRTMDGRTTGLIAALLALCSPYMLIMSSEYMNSTTTLLCLTLFFYAYIRMLDTGLRRFALLAGIALGYALITRLHSAIPFAFPILLHAARTFIRAPSRHGLNMGIMALAASCFVAFLLYYNMQITGDPFLFPKQKMRYNEIRFYIASFAEPTKWAMLGTDITRALRQLAQLHHALFGWCTSSLVFIPLLYVMPSRPRYMGLALGCFLAQCLAMVFIYSMQSAALQPRYLYESAGLCLILTAAGLRRLPELLNRIYPMPALELYRGAVAMTLCVLTITAIPSVARQNSKLKYDYSIADVTYLNYIAMFVQKPALILVKPYAKFQFLLYTMPPDDTKDVVFAQDRGEDNAPLLEYYGTRNIYFIDNNRTLKMK